MLPKDVEEILAEARSQVAMLEEAVESEDNNSYVESLMREPIDLASVEERDLSDMVAQRVRDLKKRRVPSAAIGKLLKLASRPELATLNVVENEIASVAIGEIEAEIEPAVAKKIAALSAAGLGLFKRSMREFFMDGATPSIRVNCGLDRWVLVVDEDRFLEGSELELKAYAED
jgi:hypothetical protein